MVRLPRKMTYTPKFTPEGKNPPLTVPACQMDNFIRLTSIDNDHILFVSPDKCHYKSGDVVIVTEGPFKGIKGRVARIQRQQRVVVEIDGIGCITTAYVPSEFIKITEQYKKTNTNIQI